MRHLPAPLLILLLLLPHPSSVHASQIEVFVEGLVDASPGNSTIPVRIRLIPSTDTSCSAAAACSTRSAYGLQITPCPPGEGSCVGSHAIYFQNLFTVEPFTALDFQMLPGVEYTVSGDWQIQRWSAAAACDQLFCDQTEFFERSFVPSQLVGTSTVRWSALKSRW